MAAILIVDDDPSILYFLNEVLTREKHHVTKANDGADAIPLLNQLHFDLIISDLHMKQVNGIEVLRQVKAIDPEQEVLILTGYGTVHSAVKAMKNGAFDYLTKPLNIEELRLKVRQALEHREIRLKVEAQEKELRAHQEMIARDLKLAETIQQTLLPKSVEKQNIGIHVWHRPIIGIGGDFADIYLNGDDQIYLTMVDVTGHGISAALLVNRVCSEIRKLVREKLSPAQIVFNLNNFIFDSFQRTGMFLTAFSCQLDLDQSRLLYSGCAHPPILLWQNQKQQTRVLSSQNSIIGFQKNRYNIFAEDTLTLQSGDRLLIYTDGIVETENSENQKFGINGIKKAFETSIHHPAHTSDKIIINAMDEFRQKPIRDDIYLMIAEIKGDGRG